MQPSVAPSFVLPLLFAAGAVLAFAELLWALQTGRRTHHVRQVWSDLSCAALRLPAELLVKLIFVAVYQRLQQTLQVSVRPTDALSTWVIAFLSFELVFYWTHRLSHCVPLLWAVHAVHHQSNDFNLVAGTRLGLLAPTLNYPFFLCLAPVGVPVEAFVAALYVSGGWQFVLHTRSWSGPQFLGWIVNTPSHHGSHHSTDDVLGNANFASILIGLDRLFGTYQAAREPRSVGLDPPIPPGGPWAANLRPWRDAWRSTESLRSVQARLAAFAGLRAVQMTQTNSSRHRRGDLPDAERM